MVSKSKTYAFRLHPDDIREADAMAIIEKAVEDGYTLREIMTDAILRAKGHTPEMYRQADDKISKGFIETILEEFAVHIVSELKANGRIVPSDDNTKASPFDSDEDEEMMRNLAAGWQARRKR